MTKQGPLDAESPLARAELAKGGWTYVKMPGSASLRTADCEGARRVDGERSKLVNGTRDGTPRFR